MKNADMPAMPLDSQAEGDIAQGYRYNHVGMTKREHFAAMAMQGLLASGQHFACYSMVTEAWEAADLMLDYQERTS